MLKIRFLYKIFETILSPSDPKTSLSQIVFLVTIPFLNFPIFDESAVRNKNDFIFDPEVLLQICKIISI